MLSRAGRFGVKEFTMRVLVAEVSVEEVFGARLFDEEFHIARFAACWASWRSSGAAWPGMPGSAAARRICVRRFTRRVIAAEVAVEKVSAGRGPSVDAGVGVGRRPTKGQSPTSGVRALAAAAWC